MQSLRNNRGFSLVEILVVIAISVILIGLVMIPLAQSFRMTRQAQAMVDAQDSARRAMELISRDIGEAMFVFDNSTVPIAIYNDGSNLNVNYHSGEEGPIQLPVRQPAGTIEMFTLPYGKIDFILPKMTMHCNNPEHPAGRSRDYPRYIEQTDAGGNPRRYDEAWPPCPVCHSTEVDARPRFPLEQDVTVVRYFLGLRYNDPTKVAISDLGPEEGLFGWRTPYANDVQPGEENQVVLYRVEFDPHDDTLFPSHMPVSERLADPIFFYRNAANSESRPCCEVWAERARVVGMGKYQDLVVGTYSSNGLVTSVEPTITFRFSAIDNDTFSGTYSHDKSVEYPDPVPTVYRAAYGYWTRADGITVYRYRRDDKGNEQTDAFTTVYKQVGGANHLVIVKRSSEDNWTEIEDHFDITKYLEDLENGRLQPEALDDLEMAFYVDYVVIPGSGSNKTIAFTPNRGQVYFSLIPSKLSKGRSGPAEQFDPFTVNKEFHDNLLLNRSPWPRRIQLSLPPGARVVPGSVKVAGPDMSPGANPANGATYKPVALNLRSPGLNEYRVDYDTGVIYFSRDPGAAYDIPEVAGQGGANMPILVDYKIQFNRDGDVVKGDYVTKSLITVHLGMRMFDPDSGKPHSVDLTNSIKVRNALR